MDNWNRGIIAAAASREVSDVEELQEAEDITTSPTKYLMSFGNDNVPMFEEDFIAVQPTKSPLKNSKVVAKQMVMHNHQHWRADSIRRSDNNKRKDRITAILKMPEVPHVPVADIFKRGEIICEDKELLRIKENAAADNALNHQKQFDQATNQLRDSSAKALVLKKMAEANSFVHPQIRYAKFMKTSKKFKRSPTKSTATATIMEDVNEFYESSVVDATHVVHAMILQEEIQKAITERSNKCTRDLEDLKLADQPADVFKRMWTPVDENNPIWIAYRALINTHRTGSGKTRRQSSACGKCMTIFYPHFPDDFHLHHKSEGFKTAINERVVKSNIKGALAADDEEKFCEGTTYKALIALAKEANAYRKETDIDGVQREYIKMVRFIEGVRIVEGGVKYQKTELCERCEVEGDIHEAAKQKYKVKDLADGIIKLILR